MPILIFASDGQFFPVIIGVHSVLLDVVKGIALLCIFYGHSAARGLPSRLFVCLFHIPMFFFVAGCLFKPINMRDAIWKAVDRYFVPYVFFWLLSFLCLIVAFPVFGLRSIIVQFFHPKFLVQTFIYGEPVPCRSLWFLYSLALVYLVSSLAEMVFGKYRSTTAVVLGTSLAFGFVVNACQFNINNFLPFHLETVPMGLFFYTLGRMSKGMICRLEQLEVPCWLSCVISGFCFSLAFIGILNENSLVDLHFGRIKLAQLPMSLVAGGGGY